ncbi:MAG TPA: hemerythrin domain-containing protein [Nitrospiraceae bacterium]|jgi:iron-sulfur cluster repair protein YtfE (RIC family)|nr:hemerythrin domain-containing protein [Nitrospiraceae bacterium]
MSEQKTISEFYEQDHDRLDELFKTFQKLKRADFAKAKEAFKEFKFGLQRHIVWEEDVLIPLWEVITGMSEGGPTFVMRAEHRQIGQQLQAIHGKVADQNPDSDQEEQVLLELLGSHNMKEERVLYPAIDQLTSAEERETAFRNMKNILEERFKLCCG